MFVPFRDTVGTRDVNSDRNLTLAVLEEIMLMQSQPAVQQKQHVINLKKQTLDYQMWQIGLPLELPLTLNLKPQTLNLKP